MTTIDATNESTDLHDRVAAALGWAVADARSFSREALRDLVRPISAKLAHELTVAMNTITTTGHTRSTTISATTDSVSAVVHALVGGKFRVVLDNARAKPGARAGRVVDDAGEVIGSASDYIYQGRGFAVSTKPFGGFVAVEQIEFVPKRRKAREGSPRAIAHVEIRKHRDYPETMSTAIVERGDGKVFSCSWARQLGDLTEADVRKAWRESRRSFAEGVWG